MSSGNSVFSSRAKNKKITPLGLVVVFLTLRVRGWFLEVLDGLF